MSIHRVYPIQLMFSFCVPSSELTLGGGDTDWEDHPAQRGGTKNQGLSHTWVWREEEGFAIS